jgi:hypothetical protein
MLDFNQMLEKCWEAALGVTKMAKFYQGSSPAGLHFVHCVFRGNDEYLTILVNCTSEGKVSVSTVDSPYLEDQVIHFPLKMTETEAEQFLRDAGYTNRWTVVTLRSPLYKVYYPPLYIFTVETDQKGVCEYIAVDSTNGANVFPLMG